MKMEQVSDRSGREPLDDRAGERLDEGLALLQPVNPLQDTGAEDFTPALAHRRDYAAATHELLQVLLRDLQTHCVERQTNPTATGFCQPNATVTGRDRHGTRERPGPHVVWWRSLFTMAPSTRARPW